MEFNSVNTQHIKDVKHKTKKKGILGPLTLAKIDGLSAAFCIYSCSRMDVNHPHSLGSAGKQGLHSTTHRLLSEIQSCSLELQQTDEVTMTSKVLIQAWFRQLMQMQS